MQCRLFPLAGMLLRRERDRAFGRLTVPQPPSQSALPPREVVPGVPFPASITAQQVRPYLVWLRTAAIPNVAAAARPALVPAHAYAAGLSPGP